MLYILRANFFVVCRYVQNETMSGSKHWMSRSACIRPTEKLSYVISCTHWSERWTGQYLVVAPLVSKQPEALIHHTTPSSIIHGSIWCFSSCSARKSLSPQELRGIVPQGSKMRILASTWNLILPLAILSPISSRLSAYVLTNMLRHCFH